MSLSSAADFEPLISRNQLDEATRKALRLFVGRGKRYSVKQVSNGSGVKDRIIECAMAQLGDPEHRPMKDHERFSIASFIGSAFTSELIEMMHQGAFMLPDENDTPPGALAADLSEGAAKVSRAVADGDFRPGHPNLREVGKRFMDAGAQLARLPRAA